jgi:hypothetical protein
MKKLVFAICMFFGAVAVVNAQDTTSTTSPTDPTSTTPSTQSTQSTTSTAGMQDEGRVKIKSQELPDAVKSSLESQEYRGWLVNAAYKMDAASNSATGTSSSSSTSGTGTSSSSTSTSSTSTSDTTSVGGNAGTGAYAQEVYIVELKNGAQTKTVRFDKDGKKLDDAGMNNDQK